MDGDEEVLLQGEIVVFYMLVGVLGVFLDGRCIVCCDVQGVLWMLISKVIYSRSKLELATQYVRNLKQMGDCANASTTRAYN